MIRKFFKLVARSSHDEPSRIVPLKVKRKNKSFYKKQAKVFIKQYGGALKELSKR